LKQRKRNIAIYLDEELIAAADSYARVTGTNRSWVFRSAVMRLLEELPRPAQNVSAPTQLLVDDGHWNGMPD
jgi:hypothetical protein